MTTYKNHVVVALGLLFAVGSFAAPTPSQIFFAEDGSPTIVNGVVVSPAVMDARDLFLSKLDGTVQSYGFEQDASFFPQPGAVADIPVVFTGSTNGAVTATLKGNGLIMGAPEAGRFNTTTNGTQYWRVKAGAEGAFSIEFSRAISAFGFFGTDIGDFDGVMELDLTRADGQGIDSLTVRGGASAEANNGSLLFFGFADAGSRYSKITFRSTGVVDGLTNRLIDDYFGFDDFYAADASQILPTVNPPTPVPEPGSLALVGLALFAAGWARKTQRRA